MNSSEDSQSTSEKLEDLKRELGLLHREIRRRNEEVAAFLTVLCLPMSTNRRLELVGKLPDSTLKIILERYIEEGIKSELNFDQIMEPMLKTFGFERLWKIITKEIIKNRFGEFALYKWTEMSKTHACEK